jgi:hypothetical protein
VHDAEVKKQLNVCSHKLYMHALLSINLGEKSRLRAIIKTRLKEATQKSNRE